MNKLFTALTALIFLFAVHAPAEDAWDCDYTPRTPAEISGDWEYIVLDDGTAEITYYNDRQVDVLEIPSQLDGYTVTGIGKDAISCYYELTSVTIPDSVTVIGDWAFWSCYSLISVNIPDSVTDIGERAFSECESLESVTIPGSVTSIGDCAFEGCRDLISVTISDGVMSIGENPFEYCYSLTQINVSPDNEYLYVTNGVLFSRPDCRLVCYPCAFFSETYSIPEGIQVIGQRAFCVCRELTSVTIPASVTVIGEKGVL